MTVIAQMFGKLISLPYTNVLNWVIVCVFVIFTHGPLLIDVAG